MVSYYLMSKEGDRENNEDHVGMYQKETDWCFLLADGLGGHGGGEIASQLAVEAAVKSFAEDGGGETTLARAFDAAQEAVRGEQKKNMAVWDMKTTLVALYVGEDQIQWGHIGDSRLYYFERRKLVQRTLDHSVPQMLVAAGKLREKQIRRHPDRNRLLRVLGTDWDGPGYQIGERRPRAGAQCFLLCSDGFWELIDEKKMVSCLKRASDPQDWVERMEAIVQKNGKGVHMDNYSAVAVWLEMD